MTELKLIALDAEDLSVISAHLQDAVAPIRELVYDARQKRFAGVFNRFDWLDAHAKKRSFWSRAPYQRKRSGLRFERVLAIRLKNIDLAKRNEVLSLLAISFDETDAPAGRVLLEFAGDATIELTVECIEAELRDLGAAWETRHKPRHGGGGDPSGNGD